MQQVLTQLEVDSDRPGVNRHHLFTGVIHRHLKRISLVAICFACFPVSTHKNEEKEGCCGQWGSRSELHREQSLVVGVIHRFVDM